MLCAVPSDWQAENRARQCCLRTLRPKLVNERQWPSVDGWRYITASLTRWLRLFSRPYTVGHLPTSVNILHTESGPYPCGYLLNLQMHNVQLIPTEPPCYEADFARRAFSYCALIVWNFCLRILVLATLWLCLSSIWKRVYLAVS